ncbi:hypothetical protein [Secundilactobacillus oryzae]|uniref:hypothetical protein n=1 Tax=Secundilactobacillus oryzae TaxID=1202668 RepID=UPI0006CFE861|nr:hypothetical protein [Secundilactobacillus oryzae]
MPNRLTETDLYRMKSLTQPIAHDNQYFATQTTVDEASNDYRGSLLGFTNTGELIGHFDNDNYSAKSAVAGATYLFFLSKKVLKIRTKSIKSLMTAGPLSKFLS